MIKAIDGFSGNCLGFEASGAVTASDYRKVLEPAVNAALKDNKKLRLFYRIADDFSGIGPGAMWEDFSVGMSHYFAWERIAIVTDNDWIANSIGAFGFLMPAKVKAFALADDAAARAWLQTQ
ncbi:MAG: STAS/SEC14 domain-containing protein [Parvularculaceae bacterium]|nr:STAS/SEC14 domain-containing protein [Parvularculaceae bacterium]